jgi:hypothetical protein
LRTHQIIRLGFILCSFFSLLHAQLRMKRVYFLQSGQYTESAGMPVCWDSDHNGFNEVIFRTGTISGSLRWEVWECHPYNHYELVFADTGAYPYPPGITTGNFRPNDVGDIDQDSLTDLVGPNVDKHLNPDTVYYVVTTQESPNYTFYPESLSWWFRFSNNFIGEGGAYFYFTNDLDNDTKYEISKATSNPDIGLAIWENIANNQNQIVWSCTSHTVDGFNLAFGDFDLDEKKEFVTSELGSLGRVFVRENTGDNQYELVGIDTVRIANGADVFSGNDLDGDGLPEFFVGFYSAPRTTYYLYMWEATGNNTYQRYLIDQKTLTTVHDGRRSKCGDLDGDGIEELVWATPTKLFAYKATGNNQFQQVWEWYQDHGTDECLIVNIFDMNKNGYNEIVVGGSGKTSIFEVEAVKVLRPNGGEVFQTGTQQLIRWQTFHPPRCNSLSLFYSVDNGRSYDTIITGLPGADSSYLWTVQDTFSDSCKVKIIAYGPGWQFDESDGVFTITPSGIEESKPGNLSYFKFEMLPNPAKGKIRFKIWNANQDLTLKIYNLAGELVKSFSLITNNPKLGVGRAERDQQLTTFVWDGKDDSGKKLPAGVYVYRLKTTDGISETKEFIILK